ncbi:MAG TPA: amidohydrolase family protein [Terriglobales bacterium]|nr:amidohydrolase family protein [Terriglobales bacterium]
MRWATMVLCMAGISACIQTAALPLSAENKRMVIAASTLLDGKGRVLHDTRIVIEGSKIVALDPKAGPVDYDLRGRTVLPGWIDAHVHITWSFGPDGKNAGQGGTTPEASYAAASNAWLTLMAGFTTVQSVGSPADVPLRDAIAKGVLPGPRILTAVEPLMGQGEKTGTPEEIEAFVRRQKAAGADLIKIFASGGMTRGPMTMSQEQLNAACYEAREQGLRSLVHAYRDGVRAAILAGCTEVEHGLGASEDDLRLMADRGIYLDPQAGLLLETYLKYKDRFLAPPYYTEEGFAAMKGLIPAHQEFIRRALGVPGLKIVYGTDAVAGAHGRNAEDFIYRVRDCGMDPMRAMVSANSLNAEAMRMGDQIGSIAPGLQADIIALDGDPLQDITAVRRVVFVMKGGVVFKNAARSTLQGPDPGTEK